MHQVMETFKKDNFNQSHKNTWICVNGIVECKVSHKSSSRMLERSLWQAALTREGAFLKFGLLKLGGFKKVEIMKQNQRHILK